MVSRSTAKAILKSEGCQDTNTTPTIEGQEKYKIKVIKQLWKNKPDLVRKLLNRFTSRWKDLELLWEEEERIRDMSSAYIGNDGTCTTKSPGNGNGRNDKESNGKTHQIFGVVRAYRSKTTMPSPDDFTSAFDQL